MADPRIHAGSPQRSGCGRASGKFYLMEGYVEHGDLYEEYDPATNRWQRWAPMPTARHGSGAAVLGQSIYVIAGGAKPGTSFSSVNEVFTP